MNNIVSKKLSMPAKRFDDAAANWIKQILNRDPSRRLGSPDVGGTTTVRDDKWLRDVNWEAMLDQAVTPPRLR
jgi:hypothetical protein